MKLLGTRFLKLRLLNHFVSLCVKTNPPSCLLINLKTGLPGNQASQACGSRIQKMEHGVIRSHVSERYFQPEELVRNRRKTVLSFVFSKEDGGEWVLSDRRARRTPPALLFYWGKFPDSPAQGHFLVFDWQQDCIRLSIPPFL